jgi:hypothetical protein
MVDGRAEVSAVRFPALPDPDYRNCQPAELPYWPALPEIGRHPVLQASPQGCTT